MAACLWTLGTVSGAVDYRPLCKGSRNRSDVMAIADLVARKKIPYRLADGGHTLLVPAERLEEAVALVMADGAAPRSGNFGYQELFGNKGVLGPGPEEMKMRASRAMEGEIARTVMMYDSVDFARVHITRPTASLFCDDRAKTRASVFIQLVAGRKLTPCHVRSIVNLVSHGVEGLDTNDVCITDEDGTIYSVSDDRELASVEDLGQKHLEVQRRLESALQQKALRQLALIFGSNNVSINLSASIGLTEVSSDMKRVLKEQSGEGNLQLAGLESTGASLTTTQFEGSGVRGVDVQRLSVSVLINSRSLASGKLDQKLRQAVTETVQATCGVDLARGDRLCVLAAPFRAESKPVVAASLTPASVTGAGDFLSSLDRYSWLWLIGAGLSLWVLGMTLRRHSVVESPSTFVPGSCVETMPLLASDGGDAVPFAGFADEDERLHMIADAARYNRDALRQVIQGLLAN